MTTNVPHWIYAGIDGTIATFAIVAGVVGVITANEERWAKTMAVEGYGLSPAVKSPIWAALSSGAPCVLCGLVPLALERFRSSRLAPATPCCAEIPD